MWNQWAGMTAAAPMPPMPAPQCPPPQPPPPTTAAPPTPADTTAVTAPIIGPMLPGVMPTVTATTISAAALPMAGATMDPNNPYGQYTAAQYAAMTPEQQYALQQHWQQWQAYQQEYAKWHAQYGEQYKREMAAVTSTGQTAPYANLYQQAQQPPPPPPDDTQSKQHAAAPAAKISGQPQMYAQPPPQLQQPPASMAANPAAHMQTPNYQQQWPTTPAYTQPPQQPPPQPQYNFNQPPPNFGLQPPPSFNSMPNFQQPPPMHTQQMPPSQMHTQQMPPSQMPPSQMPPSQMPPSQMPPSQMPPLNTPNYNNNNQQNRGPGGGHQDQQSAQIPSQLDNSSRGRSTDRDASRNINRSNSGHWGPPPSQQQESKFGPSQGDSGISTLNQWNSNRGQLGGDRSSQGGPNQWNAPNQWGPRPGDNSAPNDRGVRRNFDDISNDSQGNRWGPDSDSQGNRWGSDSDSQGNKRSFGAENEGGSDSNLAMGQWANQDNQQRGDSFRGGDDNNRWGDQNNQQRRSQGPAGNNQWNNNRNADGNGPSNNWGDNSRGGPAGNMDRNNRNQGNFGNQRGQGGQRGRGINQNADGPVNINKNRWTGNESNFGDNERDFSSNERNFGPNERNFGANVRNFASNERNFGSNDRNFSPNDNRAPSNNFGAGNQGPNESRNSFGPNEGRNSIGSNEGRNSFGPNEGRNRFGPNEGRNSFGPNEGRNNFGPNQNPRNWGPKGPSQSGGNVNMDRPFQQPQQQLPPEQQPQEQQQQQQQQRPDLDEESFDRQFRQWEQQFEDWKRANANHPDREMYDRYEQEFEKQRKRIMERREQMRRRKMEQMGVQSLSPKTDLPPCQPFEDSTTPANAPSDDKNEDAHMAMTESAKADEPKMEQFNPQTADAHMVLTESAKADEPKMEQFNTQTAPPIPAASVKGPEASNRAKPAPLEDKPKPNVPPYQEDVVPIKKDIKSGQDGQANKPYTEQKEPVGAPEVIKAPNAAVAAPGKRKSRFSTPGPDSKLAKAAELAIEEVITLDDDDEKNVAEGTEPMSDLFKKSDGIPGLDLVDEKEARGTDDKPQEVMELEGDKSYPKRPPNMGSSSTQKKKIPSLFDIVIEKPTSPSTQPTNTSENQPDRDVQSHSKVGDIHPDIANEIPNLNDALQDPVFMRKITEALAKAQGKEHPDPGAAPPAQFLQQLPTLLKQLHQDRDDADGGSGNVSGGGRDDDNGGGQGGRPMSFAEWQRRKGGNQVGNIGNAPGFDGGEQQSIDGSSGGPNFGGNGPNFGGNGPNFGGNGPNFGGNGPNFGGNGPAFGGNGPPFGGNGPNFGGNGPNFGGNGPNGPNFGRNAPNFGRHGPNIPGEGPNCGPMDGNNCGGPNFGRNGPHFGGNGPNFGNNRPGFGGSNAPSFNNGPNGPNFRGPNGPNFRGPNGPNFGNGGNGPNFGPNFNRGGPNFGADGPNFRGNNRNFGGNNPNFQPDDKTDMSGQNASNPFRRGGGPTAPVFDDDKNGPRRSFGGGPGSNAGSDSGMNDSNSSWVNGPGKNRDYDDFYRPVQVIDYQNSPMTPKVIDYGHKTATTGPDAVSNFSEEFRPVKTFEYGHASNSVNRQFDGGPSKKNKKKNKNNKNKQAQGGGYLQQQQQQQLQQPQQQQNNAIKQQQTQQQQQQPPEQFQKEQNTTGAQQQTQSQVEIGADGRNIDTNMQSANEELEEISDTEDNLIGDTSRDNESPPPPPPPMLSSNGPYVPPVQSDVSTVPKSIFPSTAAANENIQKTPAGHVQMSFPSVENKNTITVDEILLRPGRQTRPKKVCIILRGPPGSGKSHVAKLIKEKETEMGGANPRILSIDDYFLIENDYEERCSKTGKKIPKKEILYEYDKDMEQTYMQYLIKLFKKTITDNLYDFIIVDCNNNSLRTLNEFYCHSKDSGFMPYIIDLYCDLETCVSRNVHDRTEKDIKAVIDSWNPTPLHYIKLDVSTLLENVVEMEDAEDMVMDNNFSSETADSSNLTQPRMDIEEEDSNEVADDVESCGFLKSKWENDTTSENLARLDGTSRLMNKRKAATMEDYLQVDDWQPPTTSTDGKKRVRWADIEEKHAQEKMRAIGFVVGQTDWKRMMDPEAGNRALNKTKYIERVNKRR